jgi:hypothetical protein
MKKYYYCFFVILFILVLSCNKKDEVSTTIISDTTTKQSVEYKEQVENDVEVQKTTKQPTAETQKQHKVDIPKIKAENTDKENKTILEH